MQLVGWIRLAVIVVVAWPFLVASAAMIGVPSLTALVALLPVIAAVCTAIVRLDPILAAQLVADERVRKAWQTVRSVLLVELALGAYLTVVPVQAKPFLLAQLALVLAILGLSQGGESLLRLAPKLAWVLFAWITLSFFWNSLSPADREELWKSAREAASPAPRPTAVPQSLVPENRGRTGSESRRRAKAAPAAVPRSVSSLAPPVVPPRISLEDARRSLPDVVRAIYAALDQGNPGAVGDYLAPLIRARADTLDTICQPFSYRAHAIETIVERPGPRFDVSVRTLSKPVEEHEYLLTFVPLHDRFILERVQAASRSRYPDGVYDSDPRFGERLQAAKDVARKFFLAASARRTDVLPDVVAAGFDIHAFLASPAWPALDSVRDPDIREARMRCSGGLRPQVRLGASRKDGGACGPEGRFLTESMGGSEVIVGMTWKNACGNGSMLFQWEDAQAEARTLARFGLGATRTASAEGQPK